jgi:hypothetical protein
MEKLTEMKQTLEGLEKAAAELLQDADHGRSPHAAPLRARLSAALDSIQWHEKWMAANPKPVAQAETPQTASQSAS